MRTKAAYCLLKGKDLSVGYGDRRIDGHAAYTIKLEDAAAPDSGVARPVRPNSWEA
jgi:hypothetical protein